MHLQHFLQHQLFCMLDEYDNPKFLVLSMIQSFLLRGTVLYKKYKTIGYHCVPVGFAWYSMLGSYRLLRQIAHVSVQIAQDHIATAFHFFISKRFPPLGPLALLLVPASCWGCSVSISASAMTLPCMRHCKVVRVIVSGNTSLSDGQATLCAAMVPVLNFRRPLCSAGEATAGAHATRHALKIRCPTEAAYGSQRQRAVADTGSKHRSHVQTICLAASHLQAWQCGCASRSQHCPQTVWCTDSQHRQILVRQ